MDTPSFCLGLLAQLYAEALADNRLRRLFWYDREASVLSGLASELGLPDEAILGAAAILSPGTGWYPLVRTGLRTWYTSGGVLGPYYPSNREKAWDWLTSWADGVDPGDPPAGRKVQAFYRALLGDSDAVVLDRWSLRACGQAQDPGPVGWDSALRAHRTVAELTGHDPRDVQARAWVLYRSRHGADFDGLYRGLEAPGD